MVFHFGPEIWVAAQAPMGWALLKEISNVLNAHAIAHDETERMMPLASPKLSFANVGAGSQAGSRASGPAKRYNQRARLSRM